MVKILIVDNDPAMLRFFLAEAEFQVICVSEGVESLRALYDNRPHVVILDLVLPLGSMRGLELVKRIRELSLRIPIIVVTAQGEIEKKVAVFDAGVDDYMVKPIDKRELLARVKACLRRSQLFPPEEMPPSYSDPYVTVDFTRREVHVDGGSRFLTRIEFALLSLFVQWSGKVLSVEYLLASVWGVDYTTPPKVLRWHISNLRKKLRNQEHEGEKSPIVTMRGGGYCYKSPEEEGRDA
jgi:DNA-binding response OmpR family regulator